MGGDESSGCIINSFFKRKRWERKKPGSWGLPCTACSGRLRVFWKARRVLEGSATFLGGTRAAAGASSGSQGGTSVCFEQTASFRDLGVGDGGSSSYPLALMGLLALQRIPVTQQALTDGLMAFGGQA